LSQAWTLRAACMVGLPAHPSPLSWKANGGRYAPLQAKSGNRLPIAVGRPVRGFRPCVLVAFVFVPPAPRCSPATSPASEKTNAGLSLTFTSSRRIRRTAVSPLPRGGGFRLIYVPKGIRHSFCGRRPVPATFEGDITCGLRDFRGLFRDWSRETDRSRRL